MLPAPLPSMRTAALVLGHSPFALAFRYCPSKSTSLAWPLACHAGPAKRAEASRLSPQAASPEFARVLRPWLGSTRGQCKWTSGGLREKEVGCYPFVSGNERTL